MIRNIKAKPLWCPHKFCKNILCFQNKMCIGKLYKKAKHCNDYNTHRFCLRGVLSNKEIFDLQINKTDSYYFKLLLDKVG